MEFKMNRKYFCMLVVLLLVLSMTYAWAEEDSEIYAFPIEDSIYLAKHLMIGMFGYSEEEAETMRYEATIEFGSNATDVQVYPIVDSNEYFELSYLWDGSLIEDKVTVPSCYTYSAQTGSSDRAIQSAYHLMIGLYGYDLQVVSQFRYEVISHEDIHIIHVNVYPFPETDKYGKEHFDLEYDENLKLVNHVLPDILDFTPMYDMAKQAGRPFPWFTHEERAAYSKEYIPKEEAILRLKPSSADAIANYDFTRCVYGIPDESVLPEDDALEIAQSILMEQFGRSAAWVLKAGRESYFDITASDKPLWKFFFTYFDGIEQKQYVVRLNAKTGEIVKAFEWNDECESYERY